MIGSATISGRLNRPVALLAGFSLLVGTLAVAPVPAQAADPEPSYPAVFDACPEEIIPSAAFVDVPADHANVGDIDCIAYYGITLGTGNNRYSPDAPVIREHMALFLVRMAKLVGIDVPAAGSTPFTDIVNLSEESRAAISQIYKLGITVGTSDKTYTPARNVSRGEMALFLQRLMDQMDTVTDGRELYGYRPDDVDDNSQNREVKSPFGDVDTLSHSLYDAITELYELGVASGFNASATTYGHGADMSRAAMAEFMAAILDHSNLRPPGILAQMSTSQGTSGLQAVAMVSVRDNRFEAVKDEVVDWFYTNDPAGGLRQDGTCDPAKIQGGGDCVRRTTNTLSNGDNLDGATDRDGNLFATFTADAGDAITFYAWVGTRDGEEFTKDRATYASATHQVLQGQGNFLVKHDIPEHAAVMSRDTYIVDRGSSVEFTIQLLDTAGAALAEAGVEIDIEVESQEITVDAAAVSRGRPDPDYRTLGSTSTQTTTRTTNQDGQVVLVLDGPVRDERLDIVTIATDCCDDQEFRIAWSDTDPILVAAKPTFDPYQYRSSDGEQVEFQIEYELYDQYGDLVDRRTDRYNQVEADIKTSLYRGDKGGKVFRFTGPTTPEDLREQFSLWRVRATVEETGLDTSDEYFILVDPNVTTGSGNSQITFADPIIVWVVENARSDSELGRYVDTEWGAVTPSLPNGLPFDEVSLYPAGDGTGKFRTFFTMWSYSSDSRLVVDGDEVGVEEFERAWQRQVDDVDDITIPIYGPINFIQIK